ncbi:MAG: hypothetical protein J6P13_05945 [Kiritimatiellae bacterium]|nr:hypothetical protein [Kiritimatiellia bacterium]
MSQEWNIKSRAHVCSICGQALEDRSAVTSALREQPGGYERFDSHQACWKAQVRDWEPFSQWDGIYMAPKKEEKKEALKKEDAGEILRKLVTLDDPAMKNVVYVLAVMLERSKILVERDAKAVEGGIRRVYEDRKNGDTFVILDPRLRMENLSEVQQQVVALLSGTKTLGEVAADETAPEAPQEDGARHQEPAQEGGASAH